ncbi:MATE family efflux transporter [uncultured Amnibacterium sp.]|uniref:MATE family efflux transporter n=1 Tax=uncultured Amnibacterium sp. TaxID=1631851 RepID=UPI0035CC5163
MNDHDVLAKAPLWRALAHLCIPMMAALSVNTIYSIVNAGFIGSLHSTALLAAITYGIPVLALVMAIGGVFGVGAGTAISRRLGGLQEHPEYADDIKRTSAFAVYGSLIVGAVVGGVCLLLLGPITAGLGAVGAAAAPTAIYVGVQLAFTPVLTLAFTLEQLVRAEGAAKASMTGLIVSTVANLVFDVLFILVLGWGVAGAALAIGLANLVSVAYFVRHLIRHSIVQSLAPRWFTMRPAVMKEVFGVGVSELLQSGFLLVSSLVLNHIATFYGEDLLAGFGVAQRVVQFPEFLCMGVGMGVLPLLGFAYGRRDTARLRGAIVRSAVAIAALVIAFALPVFLLRGDVLAVFTADRSLQQLGATVLTAMLVSTLFNGFTGLFVALFQATGQTVPAIVMSVMQGVLFIPIVFGANALIGETGVIWSMALTETVMFLAAIGIFATRRRTILAPTPVEAAAAGTAVMV